LATPTAKHWVVAAVNTLAPINAANIFFLFLTIKPFIITPQPFVILFHVLNPRFIIQATPPAVMESKRPIKTPSRKSSKLNIILPP
jgi:hypothetical protein